VKPGSCSRMNAAEPSRLREPGWVAMTLTLRSSPIPEDRRYAPQAPVFGPASGREPLWSFRSVSVPVTGRRGDGQLGLGHGDETGGRVSAAPVRDHAVGSPKRCRRRGPGAEGDGHRDRGGSESSMAVSDDEDLKPPATDDEPDGGSVLDNRVLGCPMALSSWCFWREQAWSRRHWRQPPSHVI
jgi:hypothetical protein